MAANHVRLKVTEPCVGNPQFYVEAINKDGHVMTFAFGKTRDEAIGKVAQEVKKMYYNDVDIHLW